MRKHLLIFLTAAIVLMLTMPVSAAESGMIMTDVTVQEEETAYVVVSFSGDVTGSGVGITYSYDETLLKALPEECSWCQKALLSDFSKTGKEAVWAVDSARSLTGDFCVLAFRVLSPDFTQTEVRCKASVKGGSSDAESFEASAVITKICDHSFGPWSSGGTLGHSRVCETCKQSEFQSHTMDQGVLTQDRENPDTYTKVYTCTVCGWSRSEPAAAPWNPPTVPSQPDIPETTVPIPTYPQPTYETVPRPTNETVPQPTEHTHTPQQTRPADTRPTLPNQPMDFNSGAANLQPGSTGGVILTPGTDEHAGHTHDSPLETMPIAVPIETSSTEAGHNHTGEGAPGESGSPLVPALLAVAAAAVIGAAIWLGVRKRK